MKTPASIPILAIFTTFAALIHFVEGRTAIIDPVQFLSNPLTYSYRLADAFTKIVNPTTFSLYETDSNTITYQSFNADDFAPFIVNTASGGALTITYPNAPMITKPSDCNSLPKILLTANLQQNYPGLSFPYNLVPSSVLVINGLTQFTLNGVYLKVINDGYNLLFNASTSVTLTNICLQQLDPSSSPTQSSIAFGTVTSLVLTNWVVTRNSIGTMAMQGPTQINIQNFQIQFQGENPQPMILMAMVGIASIQNLTVSCAVSTVLLSPTILAVVGAVGISISDFKFQNCSLSNSATHSLENQFGNFLMNNVNSVTFTGIEISHVIVYRTYGNTPPPLIGMATVGSVTITNYYGVCSEDNNVFIPVLIGGDTVTSLTISNFTISQCNYTSGDDLLASYYGNILVQNAQAVSISAINISNLTLSPNPSSSPQPIIALISTSSTMTVSGLSMSCDPEIPILSPILLGSISTAAPPTLQVNMENFALTNCNFFGSQTISFSGVSGFGNIIVYGAAAFAMNGATISNLSLNLQSSSSSSVTSNPYSTWTLADIVITSVRNINVENLAVLSYPQNTTGFSMIARYYTAIIPQAQTTISSVTLSNSSIVGSLAFIVFINAGDIIPVGQITLEDFNISSTKFYGTEVIMFMLQGYVYRIPLTSISDTAFNQITVWNNTFEDARLLMYVKVDMDLTVYANESRRMSFQNLNFTNNTLLTSSDANIIDVIGCQIYVQNLTVVNNILVGMKLFSNTLRMASFFLCNSLFDNNTLSSNSYFVGFRLSQTFYRLLETDYTLAENLTQRAETRPFFLVNCTFSNIILTESTLLVSNNPMIIISNNTFTNISLTSSVISSFQKYSPPVPLPIGYQYIPYYPIEAPAIFANLQDLYNIFITTRASLTAGTGSEAVFFLVLQNNTFTNLTSVNGTSLIEISGLSHNATAISIKNNSFVQSTIDTPNAFSVIAISDLNKLTMEINTFTNYSGRGHLMSATSSSALDQLLISSNVYQNIDRIASYSIQAAICGTITIQNDNVASNYAESSWIQIDCSLALRPITLQNSIYSNMTISSTPGKLLALNFLKINVRKTQSDASTLVHINSCTFFNITLDKTQQGYIKEVYKNPVIIFTLGNTPIVIQNTTFELLTNRPDDKILSISSPNITVIDSVFNNFTFTDSTGGINLLFNTSNFTNVTFSHNRAKNSHLGGLMNLMKPNNDPSIRINLTFDKCHFENNIGPSAALISLQDSGINMNVTNTMFINNLANYSGVIQLQDLNNADILFANTSLQLHNSVSSSSSAQAYPCDFLDITAKGGSPVNITVENHTIITNFSGSSSSFIKLSYGYNFTVNMKNLNYSTASGAKFLNGTNTTVYNKDDVRNNEITPLSILTSRNSSFNGSFTQLNILNLNFTHATSPFQITTAEDYRSLTSMAITDSEFTGLHLENSLIYLNGLVTSDLNVSIENTNFTHINSSTPLGGGIIQNVGYPLENLNISKCDFYDIALMTSNANGGVYYGPGPLMIFSSNFNNIDVAGEGGVIYEAGNQVSTSSASTSRRLTEESTSTSAFNISESNFAFISATNGGIFSSGIQSSSAIILTDNSITDVSASSKGAILFILNNSVSAAGNSFLDIITPTDGGTLIFAEDLTFSLADFLSRNGLVIPDPDMFSFKPNYLQISIASIPNDDGIIEYFYTEELSDGTLVIRNVSTNSFEYMEFSAKVYYKSDQGLHPIIDNTDTQKESVTLSLTLYREDSDPKIAFFECSSPTHCDFNPVDFKLSGQAGDKFKMDVTFKTSQYATTQAVQVELRGCIPGEIYEPINQQCYYCSGNQYSFNTSDQVCRDCPTGATCYGGTNITLKEGYWRNSTTSAEVYSCEDESSRRCLGEDKCADEFMGPVCIQCKYTEDYISVGRGKCSRCSEKDQLISTGVFLLLGTILYQIYVLWTTLNDNQKAHEEACAETTSERPVKPGAYIVIITTYMQIISIIMKLKSNYFSQYLDSAVNAFGNPNSHVLFSLECLYALRDKNPSMMIRYKLLVYVLSPLAKIILILCFELLRAVIKRKEENIKRKIIWRLGLAAVVLTMLEQPNMIGVLSAFLSCSKLYSDDPDRYLTENTLIQCNDDSYVLFRNAFVVPALLAWGFLVPLLFFLILWRKREVLPRSKTLRMIFGSIYSTFSERAFFWGLVIIVFKILMYILDSTLSLDSFGDAKGLIFLIVIHLYYHLLKRFGPYTDNDLQRSESLVMLCFITTISLMFLGGLSSNKGYVIFCDVLILIANALTVTFILLKLARVYYVAFKPHIEKLKNRFRKKKMMKQQDKGEKSDDLNKGHFKKNSLQLEIEKIKGIDIRELSRVKDEIPAEAESPIKEEFVNIFEATPYSSPTLKTLKDGKHSLEEIPAFSPTESKGGARSQEEATLFSFPPE